jgi:hypothetical protein
LEREAEPAWREALARYELEAEAATAVEKTWRQQVAKAKEQNCTLPDRPADAKTPKKPPCPRVVVMDSSTEELQRLLADNARGLLHVRDELAGWLGSFDRYGGNGADRAFYLEAWNGDAYVCDRVRFEGVPVRIEHVSLGMIGGLVPDRLRDTLTDADDGLPGRFIFVWPEPVPIRALCDRGENDAAERRTMLNKAATLLHTLEMGENDRCQPTPKALRLDEEALALFDEQRQKAMRQARSATGLAAGWHGKNPGRLLRLALIFEFLAWAASTEGTVEPRCISADAVARAGRFIDYAGRMFERVSAGLAVTRAQADAAQIARDILATAKSAPPPAHLEPINERRLYQRAGFSWARDDDRRRQALAILTEAGWIRRHQADGHGRPRGDWEVNPGIANVKP